MEVLQCDGCDFRAESYDDLKSHIQDFHTALMKTIADRDQTPERFRSEAEDEEFQAAQKEDVSCDQAGIHSIENAGHISSSNQMVSNQSVTQPTSQTTSQFFQCKFCIRYFRSKSLLSHHTRKVHGIIGEVLTTEGNKLPLQASKRSNYSTIMQESFEKVFFCQYCMYKSPSMDRILKHEKICHNRSLLDSPGSVAESGSETSSIQQTSQESSCGMPGDILQHGVPESMVKPLTKSRGIFSCEWCSYQTLIQEHWSDHMTKQHPSVVQQQDEVCSMGLSTPDTPSSPKGNSSPSLIQKNSSGSETSSANTSRLRGSFGSTMLSATSGQANMLSPHQFSQIKSKVSNSIESSVSSDNASFIMSSMSTSGVDLETNDSRNSSDDELVDRDDNNSNNSLLAEESSKQLLSEEDNNILETKGIPFRRCLNRYHCPFCSFLATRRQSISSHIENIHLTGKTTLYKCDECHFFCTSSLKLDAHKQYHTDTSSEWETGDFQNKTLGAQNEMTVNGTNAPAKTNGKTSSSSESELSQQNPHCCMLCSFSTATLKALHDHQQHQHSYCDNMKVTNPEGFLNQQQDSKPETQGPSKCAHITRAPILGLLTKKLTVNKSARKSINDTPLDLSPVKKRTRIDEIANNLQSKISQNKQQEDTVINLEGMDDEEVEDESTAEMDEDKEDSQAKQQRKGHMEHIHLRELDYSQEEGSMGKQKYAHQTFSHSNTPIDHILDDKENGDDYGASTDCKHLYDNTDQDSREAFQDNIDYSRDAGTPFNCKHCEYHNKSARSVSTHYQRMHPYIKFNFRYILDPADESAVFRCLECYVEYSTFDDLNQHYQEHHPEALNVLNLNQPDLVYKCRFCAYTSPNVRSLMPHYQRMHPTVKINNSMIFSSYTVELPPKDPTESQTLREILNSDPKNFAASTPVSESSAQSSPIISNTQESCPENDAVKEIMFNNVAVYDCDICLFASPNMHSVLVHYQKKHPEQKASYFHIQKSMRVISMDEPQISHRTTYDGNTYNLPKDEEMYYCKHCVYSNRSVVGVLVHYQKRHPEVKVTAKYIKHAPPTPGLMKLMEELQIALPKQFRKSFKNNATDTSLSRCSGVKGEVEMFFCQHCDYGNRTVKGVLIHYQKKHRDVKANGDLVRRHTSLVRSQRERAQMSQSSKASVTASKPDSEEMRPLRSLKCWHCTYTSPYVYALKKHLKKDHPTVKATVMTILHWAYRDGVLQPGYHCEWCIYSHAEPNGLLMHYQRRHPEHNVDYAHMATKLWAGPDNSASPQARNSDAKHYQCRNCAFEACSIWDITNHYQAVHPWAVEGDESLLLDIIKSSQSSEEMQTPVSEVHVALSSQFNKNPNECNTDSLHTAETPAETATCLPFTSTSISHSPFQCTVCFSEYNSLHGLLTHYGKKHPGMKVKAADFAQDTDANPSAVYKCRHCPYVNSRIHGVLTHYQKKHPLVKVTAEDFADDIEQMINLNEGEEKCKSQRQGYGAYRCKICPYSHGTLQKLKIHYEKYHNQPASEMFKPVRFPVSKVETPAECSFMSMEEVNDFNSTLEQFPIIKGERHAVFRCQLCKYFCSTRKGIARHYRIKHNNVRAQPEGTNNVFKCAICSYTNPVRKGLAAHYQKRHDIDAYYTHCLAATRTLTEKLNKAVVPVTSQCEGSSLNEELKLAIERKKCSLCSFQALSRKSIIRHYLKCHPRVLPKRYYSSKLGRYFTIVYAKEPQKSFGTEMKKETSEYIKSEQDSDVEWLPFKCIRCFKLSFNTAELLCMHYNDYHSKDLKKDFITLSSSAQNAMDSYHCAQCDHKCLDLLELSTHLTNHSEELYKPARQERRNLDFSMQRGTETLESQTEKLDTHTDKAPVGYRCNFCMEVHPSLRAICNHLRKHIQYGEVKAGHVKQEVTEMPVTVPAEGLARGDVVEVEASAPRTNSAVSQAAVAQVTAAVELETGAGKARPAGGHPCGQCDRVFMSMQGLRSHERSHSAMTVACEDKYSCQYCNFISPFRHNLDRHVQSYHGHHKPFRCKLCSFKSAYLSRLKNHVHKADGGENAYRCASCSFSTMTISQLKEHCLKSHGKSLTLPELRAATQMAFRPKRPGPGTGEVLITPLSKESVYFEPPDVHKQLSQYQQEACTQVSNTIPSPPEAQPRPECILTCEFCDFSSGYIQSLRRHYRDRHGGKKLFKCKECSFFTCCKSTFTLHVEAGHSSIPEEDPKDLRCPLCLYHTKYKSNMIDHIILHREERVVPLEVCRSKLSRHLQGVVFRCHKCTFTCSSDESLQVHIQKHDRLKPYKCQLCFYDSMQSEDLEAHLHEEHKVIRNFELMGRVNLDQLEADKNKLISQNKKEEKDAESQDVEEAKKPDVPDGAGSGPSICNERHFCCEFCGRAFSQKAEWERHVHRHGMSVANNGMEVSQDKAVEAPAQSEVLSVLVRANRDFLGNILEVESQYPSDLAKNKPMDDEDQVMPSTRNDP